MAAGVAAVLLGLLALACSWWLPTATLLFGPLAVVTGLLGRRRLATGVGAETTPSWAQRLTVLGTALGTAAIVATVIVVIVTTG